MCITYITSNLNKSKEFSFSPRIINNWPTRKYFISKKYNTF